jgi:hypothetical protein
MSCSNHPGRTGAPAGAPVDGQSGWVMQGGSDTPAEQQDPQPQDHHAEPEEGDGLQ